MFSFYVPDPDFLHVGEACCFDECFGKMKLLAEAVYGQVVTFRYAAGVITAVSLMEALGLTECVCKDVPSRHFLRIKGEWYEVPEDVYKTYSDKFISSTPVSQEDLEKCEKIT